MDNRKVLALKYRPKNFSDLIGQDAISKTLSHALDNKRLAHAYLFSGIRGSGKTSSARIFSKSLNCDKGPTSNPCETCENCLMANESRHIDIIEMDAASSRKIDDVRDLIEHTRYKPTIGRYKIFIIDEVHMLTKEAFNALLKTLEEPPEYVKFILATTDPLKLPATILSRTQHFRFKKIGRNESVNHMEFILDKEGVNYEKEALEILSRSGSGSLRDSLTLLEQAIVYGNSNVTAGAVADMLGLVDPSRFNDMMDAVFNKDIQTLKSFAKELDESDAEIAVDEMIEFLSERMYEHDPKYSTMVLDRFFRILAETKSMLSMNVSGQFALMLMFYKMVEAFKVREIDDMIEALEQDIAHKSKEPSPQSAPPSQPEPVKPANGVVPAPKNSGEKLFKDLIAKVYERNYELGAAFEENVEFVSFENGELCWNSYADDEVSAQLRANWQPIKQLVGEIFGIETKIKLDKKEPKKKIEKSVESEVGAPVNPVNTVQPDSGEQEESLSTTMDIIHPTSCASPQLNGEKELSKEELENHPMLQKARELFPTKNITVFSKV